MKKTVILLLSFIMNSCFLMPLGSPHSHQAICIDEPNSEMKIWVSCQPHNKYYKICGVEKTDTIYISSEKIKKHSEMTEEYFLCGDSLKSYRLRIGDANFHRNLMSDTLRVKIVKSNSYKIHKFLMVKDHYIKN